MANTFHRRSRLRINKVLIGAYRHYELQCHISLNYKYLKNCPGTVKSASIEVRSGRRAFFWKLCQGVLVNIALVSQYSKLLTLRVNRFVVHIWGRDVCLLNG